MAFIGEYEEALADVARRHQADGVICGHIHHAADRRIGAIHYLNTGDWVESCTAIAETRAGDLTVIRWHDVMRTRAGAEVPVGIEAAA